MEEINNYNENCFEVFLGEKMIGDVTDLLIRTIQYLKKIGKKVKLSGVDEKNMPMVEVDGEMYYFKKVGEHSERARFIRLVDEEKELEKNK